MDHAAHLCGEKPPFYTCSPLSFQNLEESRARLLRPITPSAPWLAALKPLNTQSSVMPDNKRTSYSLNSLNCRHPVSDLTKAQQKNVIEADHAGSRCDGRIWKEPTEDGEAVEDQKMPGGGEEQNQTKIIMRVQPLATGIKKPLPCLASSEPKLLWLENPFLKQPSSASLSLLRLEESRDHLLRPIATSAPHLTSSKPLEAQFRVYLDLQETPHLQISPSSHGAQDDVTLGSSNEADQQQGKGDEPDTATTMPEYILAIPEDSLKMQAEENDSSGDELQLESGDEDVKEQKLMLLSLACCSLVEGAKFGDPPGELQRELTRVCTNLAEHEPEFVLKVALYTRQELNIRSMANFLLALSSRLLPCRPHLRRYFCHAVQLPSDWMEVARIYQSLAGGGKTLASMPSCLRSAMADKFRQFDAYQLAKYNTRKSLGKKRHKPKAKKWEGSRQESWKEQPWAQGKILTSQFETLEKRLQKCFELKKEQPPAPKDQFSLKALIQRLHISEPALHVMSLLGRKYPSDLHTFSRSRLPGPWDSSLAGTRMKLPKPHTWDRELSKRGNNASAWEDLIDSGQLPFMAMLRNLRNILRAGVSERHHKRLLKRLEDKNSVIRSRQLPFRFLAAYKIILGLEKALQENSKPFPQIYQIIQGILKELGPHPDTDEMRAWDRRIIYRLRKIPAMFRLVRIKKKKLQKARDVRCSRDTLKRYCQALETAVSIAVRHNLPPIPGRTLILISCTPEMRDPYMKAKELCCPDPDKRDEVVRNTPPLTKMAMAMLLGSMVYSASEQAQLLLCNQSEVLGPVDMTGSVLKDAQALQSLSLELQECTEQHTASDVVMNLLTQRQHVDTILLLSCKPEEKLRGSCQWMYRHQVSPGCLFVNVCADAVSSRTFSSRSDVVMSGFSEHVLRFIAECGDSWFLEHVGKMDEIHGLPKQRGVTAAKQEATVVPLIPAPKSRWRSVRIFISSTFRDMHGERDLLTRSVFPELRARAAQFCLAVEDIDLRWGITEHESQRNKQLELCLSEVCQSQLFIGLLGERYGHVPSDYFLPDEPQYEWIKSYPVGRSVTELEAVQFLKGCKNPTAESRAFFYLRESDFLGSVPEAWKADFVAESEEAKRRVANLKEHIGKHEGLASFGRYKCQWGGVAHGRPYVKGLEDFGIRVLKDVWECLRHHYIERDGASLPGNSEEEEGSALQESFQELQQRRCCARTKLLHATVAQLRGGRIYVVSGEPGQGKTVFLAALAQELRSKAPAQGAGQPPSYHVVAHFAQARPDQAGAQVVLGRLCASLRKLLDQPPAPPGSYRGLVVQFGSLLHSVTQSLKRGQSLVVLIDGADLIHTAKGQLISDWLPEQLPQRASLILSVSEESALLGSLKRRTDVIHISLGPLDPPDRVAIIRKDLALYGKKLEESAFNNQMRLVLLKKGSRQPLYLTLLTQDLRLFALYEKLSERIQKLPVSLPLLLQHLLGCLEQDHGLELVAVALVSLWASRDGLTERDLYGILATWKELNRAGVTFEEAMVAGRHAGSYPVAPFVDFLRSLRGLLGACGSLSEPPGSRLHLCGTPLRAAVERRYLKKPGLDHVAHVLLAAHWWKLADPDGSGTFRNSKAESLRALPYHLVQSGQLNILASFLTSLNVMRAHLSLGLLCCLSEAYALYETAAGTEKDETVDFFRAFLQRNLVLLSQNPLLLLQQAVNEPDSSELCSQARAALGGNRRPFLRWANKRQKAQKTNSLVLTLPATPSCVSVAPSGKLAVVGTTEGMLHLVDVETGQEVKALLSTCDGISAVEFLSETRVCLGAFNGRFEVWSLTEGCRLVGIDAHMGQITECCISLDHRVLATVSLDGYLKLWDSTRGELTRKWDSLRPLNCVTFHPDSQLVAVGGWDRTVTILDAHEMSVISMLKGHDASVRSIAFSSAGNILIAGSLVGSISLWSWREAVVLGAFSAHSGCVSAVRFLPGGKLLTVGEDCKVQLWEGRLGQYCGTLGSATLSPALCVVPSPDGRRLAVGHHSDDVWVYSHPWGTNAGSTHCRASGVAVCSLAWLEDRFLIGGRSDGSLCLWNTSGLHPSCLHKLQGHEKAVTGLAVSGKLVASTSEDFTVRLWLFRPLTPDPVSPLAVLRGHTGGVTCCAFSPDGGCLATGGKDRALFLWDVKDPSQKAPALWKSLLFCHQDWISSCSWAGPTLLSASNDGTVRLWDPQTSQRLREFLGHQSPVCGVTSERDHVISVGRDGTLVSWDLQGVEKTRFFAHPGGANHCASFIEPGEKDFTLAAAGWDGTVKLWKPLTMEQPQRLPGHCAAIRGAAASPASFLTISEDKTVRVWALPKEGDETKDLPPHGGAVTALAWSPDGEFAVSGSDQGDLVVWHQARDVGTAKVGRCCIRALAFTSSRTVLVASDDVSLWDIKTSRQRDGGVSLTLRKLLRSAEEASVLCLGKPSPRGPLVLALADGDLLVLPPKSEDLQTSPYSGGAWDKKVHVGFEISAPEDEEEGGVLHVWDSMNRPNLFRMEVTESGALKDTWDPEHIPWAPTRLSGWVTVARLVKDKSLFCADSEGCLWTQTQQNEERVPRWIPDGWQRRKLHSDKITALHILGDKMITASHDQDVKIWERSSTKLLGQFRCRAPVSQLLPCPRAESPLLLIAGDILGNVYFLEWS
uniref:Telomerase protein component 1 isoform X1 n=1 Tax=Pogona vitticeps TaxID=103695 RepID=A0ABM5EIR4_9SAUR